MKGILPSDGCQNPAILIGRMKNLSTNNTATSVSAQASTSTTEFTLSVGEYHALQYKNRVEDKAAAPETILVDSSVWNTDGSMPTDYASDIIDIIMEDREVSSSVADSQSAAVAHDPVRGPRRHREDKSEHFKFEALA
ncbi:hypothetical protein JG688_00014181 [Phytophthora aleatoria]|uniref:Uncharacterized protein n=1 Tax=Phytophthora aleatoria TaxID=2496075 RepID=A0A8J5IXE1_9STRA|nr:hypothetical protein JG688_00014181 [Phytophthora aleatoria]